MIALAGNELPARGLDFLPPSRRVVQHAVHGQERHDSQHLLGAGEVRREEKRLQAQREGVGRVRDLVLPTPQRGHDFFFLDSNSSN